MKCYRIATACLTILLATGCSMAAQIVAPVRPTVGPAINENALKRLKTAKPITVTTAPGLSLIWHGPISSNPVQQVWPIATDGVDGGRIFTCHMEKIPGTSATKAVLRAASALDGTELWNITTPSSTWLFQNPICAEGKLLVTGGSTTRAYDPATGTKLWETSTPGGSCMVWGNSANGVIYHSTPGRYSALQIATGVYLWTNGTGISPGGPTAAGSVLYAASETGLKMMSAGTGGGSKWTMSKSCAWSTPVVRGNVVYCTGPGHVTAVDTSKGTAIWQNIVSIDTSPANPNPLIMTTRGLCVITHDGKLISYDPRVGTEMWRCDANMVRGARQLPVVNDVIFLPGKTLTAINSANGAQLWRYDPGKPESFTTVAVVNDNILVAQFGPELYVFETMN